VQLHVQWTTRLVKTILHKIGFCDHHLCLHLHHAPRSLQLQSVKRVFLRVHIHRVALGLVRKILLPHCAGGPLLRRRSGLTTIQIVYGGRNDERNDDRYNTITSTIKTRTMNKESNVSHSTTKTTTPPHHHTTTPPHHHTTTTTLPPPRHHSLPGQQHASVPKKMSAHSSLVLV
jgi:hypothetical protein